MPDKITSFRQPLITATGIILGFSLDVAAGWVPNAFKSNSIAELFLAIGTLLYIPLFTIVMYRVLRMNYPIEKAEKYYTTTLILFITGISFFYLTIFSIIVERFIVNRM